jgi:hypothetical protein
VHNSMESIILVPVAVELVTHNNSPVSLESICPRFEKAFTLEKSVLLRLIIRPKVVDDVVMSLINNCDFLTCLFYNGFLFFNLLLLSNFRLEEIQLST